MATNRKTITVLSGDDLEDVLTRIDEGFAAIADRLSRIEEAIATRQKIDHAKVVATDALRAVVTRPPATKGRR